MKTRYLSLLLLTLVSSITFSLSANAQVPLPQPSAPPLSCTATGPQYRTLGQSAALFGKASNGTSPYSYTWNGFGGAYFDNPATPTLNDGSNIASPVAYFTASGIIQLKLTCTDANGASVSSTVTVTVSKAFTCGAGPYPYIQSPYPPIFVRMPHGVRVDAALGGGRSPFSFRWTGTSEISFDNRYAQSPTVTSATPGAKSLGLECFDANGAKYTSGLTFTVLPRRKLAFVLNIASNNVSVADVESKTVLSTIPVGSYPTDVAVNRNGSYAYVANRSSGNISIIDADAEPASLAGTIALGNGALGPRQPASIALNQDGSLLYVTDFKNPELLIIDTATRALVGTIPYPMTPGTTESHGSSVVLSPTSSAAYILTSPSITVVDTATRTFIKNISFSQWPDHLAISPDGRTLFAQNGFYVQVIDAANLEVRATITVGYYDPGPFGGSGAIAIDIALSPDGTRAYVTRNGNTIGSKCVLVIDTATNKIIQSPRGIEDPSGIAITAEGAFRWVTDWRYNYVRVFNNSTNALLVTIPVGTQPRKIALRDVP